LPRWQASVCRTARSSRSRSFGDTFGREGNLMAHASVSAHPASASSSSRRATAPAHPPRPRDELLSVVEHFDIVDFPRRRRSLRGTPTTSSSSRAPSRSRPTWSGSWSSAGRDRFLVTIGACATAAASSAPQLGDHDAFGRRLLEPRVIASLARSTPISEHVTVDAELRGCRSIRASSWSSSPRLTTGRRPQLRDEAVCMECSDAASSA